MEKWKFLTVYNGMYQVSNEGRIKSFLLNNIKGRILSLHLVKRKYTKHLCVSLMGKEGNRKSFRVHRLVALMFIPNPDNKKYVKHIDFNGENNKVDNLRWDEHRTRQERHTQNIHKIQKVKSAIEKQKREDMVGNQYNNWLVLNALPREYKGNIISKMLCRCDCGEEKEVDMVNLKNGRSRQCKSCSAREASKKRKGS